MSMPRIANIGNLPRVNLVRRRGGEEWRGEEENELGRRRRRKEDTVTARLSYKPALTTERTRIPSLATLTEASVRQS